MTTPLVSHTNSKTLPFCLPDNISPEQFLAEYWQKKPLLIKQGLPQLIGMFEPEEMLGLALEEEALARLITQSQQNNWTVKKSPLLSGDFENLPTQWTVLIQNLEQWSPELGQLWQAFDFIPQWQRDDIMVSYAPKGGSVGKHYDDYDVFLAQGYGQRRWQLGKYCDQTTEFMPDQPIRIFDDMGEIIFDEVLQAGDVLYVPPKLSHFGVAQDDCLTFSFGFRRPNLMQILDSLADVATSESSLFVPMLLQQPLQASGQLLDDSITQIKQQLLTALNSPQGDNLLRQAISEVVSKRQYDVMIAEDAEAWDIETLYDTLIQGAIVQADANSRLLYTLPTNHSNTSKNVETVETIKSIDTVTDSNSEQDKTHNQQAPLIYANGQPLEDLSDTEGQLLVRLADGETLNLHDFLLDTESQNAHSIKDESIVLLDKLLSWLENGWVWIDTSMCA